jgi:hypothetical protein
MKNIRQRLLIAVMFLLCISAACSKSTNTAAESGNAAQKKEAAIKISAEDLMREWTKDRAAADAKYANRKLEISGTAVSVDNSGDQAEIRLSAGEGNIICLTEATDGTEKLSRLISDKRSPAPPKITVTGTYSTEQSGGNRIQIAPCEPPYTFQ